MSKIAWIAYKGFLLPLVMAAFCFAGNGMYAETTESVLAEAWTTRFPAVLRQAQTEHRPVLMFVKTKGCVACDRMEKVFTGEPFRAWVKGTGIYLAKAYAGETNDIDQAALNTFCQESPYKGFRGTPRIGIYWPRATNDETRLFFCGRRGVMPGKKHHVSLAGEFFLAMDTLLGDYLGSLPSRPSLGEILNSTKRIVKPGVQGEGKVEISPENGEMVGERDTVTLKAVPAEGWEVAEWRGPDGEPVVKAKNRQKLTVSYSMGGGTYSVVFKKVP